jgi:hypothetical protein
MRPIDDAYLQVGLDADLTRQPGIRLEIRLPSQPLLFELTHGRRIAGQDLDTTRGAPCVAAATVEDVDPGILDPQDQLFPRLDLE